MKITFTLEYNRKKKFNKEGKAPIELRAYNCGKNKYISTKIYADPTQWNEKKKELTSKHPQYVSLNLQLRKIITDFEAIQTEHIINDKPFTLDTLETFICNGTYKSFTTFIQNELAANNLIQLKTKVAHQNTLNKLNEFKKDVLFKELNYDFIQRFDYMLRNKKYAINTIDKHHKNILIYINLAIKKGYMELNENPYKHFKRTTESTNKQALSMDEVKKMENLSFKPEEAYLEKIRDMFLFACYTGLRISDVLRINSNHVYKSEEGWVIDNMKSKKSNKDIFIPLEKLFPSEDGASRPVAIIQKYYKSNGEQIFSNLSEPYINRRLKEISHLANIDKKVTFHIARNTFATTMAQKISTPVLQQLLQHSDIKTTMVYVKLSKQMIRDGVDKVNWA